MGRLTTHVLDTAAGRPAAGLRIDLHRLEGGTREALVSVTTNGDGRVDGPLLANDAFTAGRSCSERTTGHIMTVDGGNVAASLR